MRGYDDRSYGDGFADVYDDWYADVTDVDATVGRMLALAGPGGRVLELGVGTGRLALPMAARRSAGGRDRHERGDARTTRRPRPWTPESTWCRRHGRRSPRRTVRRRAVAYNTIFNLPDEQRQRRASPRSPDDSARAARSSSRRSSRTPTAGHGRVRRLRAIAGRRPRRALGVGQRPRRAARRGSVRPDSPSRAVCGCGRGRSAGRPPTNSTRWQIAPGWTRRSLGRHVRRRFRPTTAPTTCPIYTKPRHATPKCALKCAPSAHEMRIFRKVRGVGSRQKEW